MTDMNDPRRKRLRFRAWHRGTKELDHIVGTFADRHLASMDDDELGVLEALLEENDVEVFGWIVGKAEAPQRYAGLLARLQEIELKPGDYV